MRISIYVLEYLIPGFSDKSAICKVKYFSELCWKIFSLKLIHAYIWTSEKLCAFIDKQTTTNKFI